jgi:hypothetical protein
VTHGHFEVNGHRVDVPSYRVEQYDIITIRKQSIESFPFSWPGRPSASAPSRPGCRSSPARCRSSSTSCPSASRSTPAHRAADRRALLQELIQNPAVPLQCPARGRPSRTAQGFGARRADRQVTRPGRGRPAHTSASNSGRRRERRNHSAHRTASRPHRGGRRRQPQPVRHRAARARLRLHPRQLPAPHAAVEHPRCRGHQHPIDGVLHEFSTIPGSRRTSPRSSSTSRAWSSPPETTSRS